MYDHLRAEFLLQLRDYLMYMHPQEYSCIESLGGIIGTLAAYSIFRRDLSRGRLRVNPREKRACIVARIGRERVERCVDLERLFCTWRRLHVASARVRELMRQVETCQP